MKDKEGAKKTRTTQKYAPLTTSFLSSLGKRAGLSLAAIGPTARADMKLVRSGRFESGGFFGLRAVFLHPFHTDLFLFRGNKEKMQRPETTFIPFFHSTFNPPTSIHIHAGPRTPLTCAFGVPRLRKRDCQLQPSTVQCGSSPPLLRRPAALGIFRPIRAWGWCP